MIRDVNQKFIEMYWLFFWKERFERVQMFGNKFSIGTSALNKLWIKIKMFVTNNRFIEIILWLINCVSRYSNQFDSFLLFDEFHEFKPKWHCGMFVCFCACARSERQRIAADWHESMDVMGALGNGVSAAVGFSVIGLYGFSTEKKYVLKMEKIYIEEPTAAVVVG